MKDNRSMNSMFKGYSDYSNDEYKEIWDNSLIVVDANILLNFYRYSEDTREKLFKILKKVKKRLWIPYQVGKEFFENKDKVMVNSYKEYDTLENELQKKFRDAKDEINKRKNDQLKCKNDINTLLDETLKKIQEILNKEKEVKKPNFNKNLIEKKVLELFNTSIGEQITGNEYDEMKKEGIRRFENQIPPGYKDSAKDENGDYYIFYSLIKKAKEVGKDIIFVTDDVKEDWFNQLNGERHGGRYELLNEFYKETNRLLLIYTSAGFAEAYNKNIEENFADENTINELKSIRSILNKNYYENSFITDGYLDMVERYKNSDNLYDKEKLIDALRLIIRKMNIPVNSKEDLLHDLRMLRREYYFNKSNIRNAELENLISKITDYYKLEYKDISYENKETKKLKEKYYEYLVSIMNCKSNIERHNIYSRLVKSIKEDLVYLSNLPRKGTYMLYKELESMLEILNNPELEGKDNVIRKLESILKLIYE